MLRGLLKGLTSGQNSHKSRRTRFRQARASFAIERRTQVKNEYGEEPDTWAELFTRQGKPEPINGREYFSNTGEHADVNIRLRFRYDTQLAGVTPHDRLKRAGKTYDIRAVIDPDEAHHELIFMCRYDATNQR